MTPLVYEDVASAEWLYVACAITRLRSIAATNWGEEAAQ